MRLLEQHFRENDTEQERHAKKVAEVLEAIVLTQSEMSQWLGNATTLRTALFDDYVNKVDMIAEWNSPEQGKQVLALAVDVTFGFSTIDKKLRAIRSEIDSGSLGSIRYFRNEEGTDKDPRHNVPRTVIGISQAVVEELAMLWINGEKRALGQHAIQRIFVEQITSQLRAMESYARRTGKEDIAQEYRKALDLISPINEEKKSVPHDNLVMDPVAAEIANRTEEMFGRD